MLTSAVHCFLQVASPAQSRGQRVMVFSNTVASCRAAEHYLKEAGLRTVSYHGEVPSGEVGRPSRTPALCVNLLFQFRIVFAF